MVQVVATTAERSYRLSYDAAGRADETNADALEVIITDQTNHTRICIRRPTASKTAFHRFTLNFTARSGLTAGCPRRPCTWSGDLTFAGSGPGGVHGSTALPSHRSGWTHVGGRFSMNARIPSRGSSECSSAQNIVW